MLLHAPNAMFLFAQGRQETFVASESFRCTAVVVQYTLGFIQARVPVIHCGEQHNQSLSELTYDALCCFPVPANIAARCLYRWSEPATGPSASIALTPEPDARVFPVVLLFSELIQNYSCLLSSACTSPILARVGQVFFRLLAC